MRLSKKKILYSLLGLALLGVLWFVGSGYLFYGSPFGYRAEAIEAWVIDTDTKKPLQGVIVTANWQLEGGWEGHYPMGQLRVMETVTDKAGRFSFPAWGPKRPKKGTLKSKDPQLLFFKPNYKFLGLRNAFRKARDWQPVRRSDWHGKTIELKKFNGSTVEYARNFEQLNHELEFATRQPKDCNWKDIPRTIRAMRDESKSLQEKGMRNVYSIDWHLILNDENFVKRGGAKCGSPKEFFQNYQQ